MNRLKFQSIFEVAIILIFASIPLLVNLPYRSYVYLSWEGAYRLSEGQAPFRDFGLPLGGMYWVVPGIFFKVFGPQVITLVKAQFFLNVVSGLTFRTILKTLKFNPLIILPAVLLYCLSYSFQNFWPWYNHTVIVYAFLALLFCVKSIFNESPKKKWVFPLLASFFAFCSIFTKHDAGVLSFLLCICLFVYLALVEKKWIPLLVYLGGSIVFIGGAILYFSQYGFLYWFNYGQNPHNARLDFRDLINTFLNASEWIKFYIVVIVLLVIISAKSFKEFICDKSSFVPFFLTLGVLGIASIIQVTSYVPENGNIFFHSFAAAFILNYLFSRQPIIKNKGVTVMVLSLGIVLWWSRLPWEYAQRLFFKDKGAKVNNSSADGENVVNMHNAKNFRSEGVQNESGTDEHSSENAQKGSIAANQKKWVLAPIPILKNITIPRSTADGIERVKNLDIVKQKAGKGLNVLNMSEVTFLAAVLPYELERNHQAPLWHHLGVGMFNKQLAMYTNRIENNYYDLVLYEYIPTYNNFFPFGIQESLKKHYEKVDEFNAPRANNYQMTVEVYIKKRN